MASRIDNETWARHWSCLPADAPALCETLQRQLFAAWNNPRTLPDTGRVHVFPDHLQRPGATGMYLLERMGVDLTPLPPDLQLLISSTACQHRVEFWPRTGEVPRIVYYDGRLMYAGCCSNLGIAGGRYRRVEGEEITPEERGRARVRFEVPQGWVGVGLLACKPLVGDTWTWPDGRCAGGIWETWADVCEIRYARQQGWCVWVLEKITWPESRPLDLWAQRLSRLYLTALEAGNRPLARCYRSICLHAIGRMHNLGYRDQVSTVAPGDERATFDNVQAVRPDGVTIKERVRVDKEPNHIHPEWSAAIWARCHLKIARFLTGVSRETLVAVRGDAVYLTEPATDLEDDGKAGRLRIKSEVAGPLPAPQSWADLEGLLRG